VREKVRKIRRKSSLLGTVRSVDFNPKATKRGEES
jgi:hypothetical protein